jgi:mRNA-degrading endonuclease toxin of MazEF toxin-antitoxin module
MLRGDVMAARVTRRGRGASAVDELFVVVQADALDDLPTVIVAPVAPVAHDADGHDEPLSYRPRIVLGDQGAVVCCDRLRAEPRASLGAIVARLDVDEQAAVDEAVRVVLAGGITAPRRRRG